MSEPTAPTWNCQDGNWSGDDGDIMSARLWDWHCGGGVLQGVDSRPLPALQAELKDGDAAVRLRAVSELGLKGAAGAEAVDDLAVLLRDEKEPVRTNAAYALGAMGEKAVPVLAASLGDESEAVRLVAAHGLAQAGAVAAPTLLAALQSNEEPARGFAAFALGDMGAQSGAGAAVAMAMLVDDPSEWVRRNVAEALGRIDGDADAAVTALCQLLKDEDGQTRYEAAYALARLGEKAAAAVPDLAAALYDTENRYVSGHSVTALQRIGTPEAQVALFDYLSATRWCSMTTKESTF